MSNEKTTIRADKTSLIAPKIDDAGKKTNNVKVVSLTIDENDDFGGDPYNHTGSHAVPDFALDD